MNKCVYVVVALLCFGGTNWFAPAQAQDSNKTAREIESLRMAIDDLIQTYPQQYVHGGEYQAQLKEIESNFQSGKNPAEVQSAFDALKRKALLDNPLLKEFDSIIAIRRKAGNLGLPANWESNSSLRHTGYNNDMVQIPLSGNPGELTTLYRPAHDQYIGELDLHFNADRVLFSQPALNSEGGNDRWQLFELNLASRQVSQIETIDDAQVDNYDGCYLPDGRIIFTSTAPMVGVPCVRGASHVTNLFVKNTDSTVRQTTFDQEHNWNPTVMPNGRIMYLRWEYTDIPHAFYRLLFSMNPDGTNQVEYYGSNSYWPNSMFNAKPTPGNPNRFFAVVVGHHDVARAGELVLFDTSISNFEADGAIQKIGRRGEKVEAKILDGLTQNSWPKFLHPAPLSDKYVLTACKPNPSANWGIYLADVFDNFVLISEQPGFAMLEPIPLKKTPLPPAIADRTDSDSKDATVFLADIYSGPGLKGIKRGEVKALRVFTYNFSYHGMGGQVDRVGFDGPWDVRCVLGTVPVESDGSAHFTVPANTPIALQPLDENGAAIQLMRSWFTAMPGEVVSCVGCHARNSMAPVRMKTIAGNRAAAAITPFYGPNRGFSFRREIQPILDKYCVGCHSETAGELAKDRLPSDMPKAFSLEDVDNISLTAKSNYYNQGANFSPSYINLRRFVRGHTIESDVHLLSPREFHVNTTRLFQTLKNDPAGHYGVAGLMQPEDWDKLTAWVDMNTPFHGTWVEISGSGRTDSQSALREKLRSLYGGIDVDQEKIYNPYQRGAIKPVLPEKSEMEKALAVKRQEKPAQIGIAESFYPNKIREIVLPNGQKIPFVYIPRGKLNGQPVGGFWISQYEITNAQFKAFFPQHDSRYEFGDFLVFSLQDRGFQVDGDSQPVVRVSHEQANAFCQSMNESCLELQSQRVSLPTSLQWNYAARAGVGSEMWYGDLNADFSSCANLSDKTNYDIPTYAPWSLPSGAIPPWRPADIRFNDKYRATAPVGSFAPNGWKLYDVQGNAAEWTLSPDGTTAQAVGGSFNSRPADAAFDSVQIYPVNQPVYDVGFRIIIN